MKFKKLITLASLVGLIVFLATTVVACTSKSENTETKTAQVEKNKEKELKEALDKAKSYDKSLNLSYNAMEKKLLEEDFSEEAVKYALSNVDIDWKQNALEKAKEYAKTPLVSRKVIKEKLDYEDGFDDPEVNYAIDNVDVDWKKAAIEKAKDYAKNNHLSSFNTESELQRENRFTPEEAKYAVENAGIDWKEIALERAKELKQSAPEPDFAISDTRDGLQSEQFRDEEVKYAMDNLKK